jgi:hypothetical protein
MINKINKFTLILFTAAGLFLLASCGKTEEKTPEEQPPSNEPIQEEVIPEEEPVEEPPAVIIADIVGKWTGTFDKRSTVLNITEQTDSSFSGKISISYREAINQDVKGTFSPATLKMSMKDQLHSRYRGKYSGKLSEDGKNFSGTFIMDLDGSKLSFDLNKK